MKNPIKKDLKHFGRAFIRVYPATFRKIVSHWQITLFSLFAILSAFYFDQTVRLLITGINNNIIDSIFVFGRWYGSGEPTLILFLGIYIIGLVFKEYEMRETGLLIGEAYIFSGIVTLTAKSAFGRFRPYTNQGDLSFYGWNLSNNDMFSYFSGHASVSFALSTILASTTNNIYLKTFYYLLAVITCLSRIYHEQHWFSDVLTGAIVAYLISKVLIEIDEEAEANSSETAK
ncbi:MAG: phosphatase PAP2 family protein [Chlorobi bacterium]|nr:phosphatase PAP2 family protein [Chlorobiota bacterium]MCI0716560.1 phosphatase PAP2 family protein [Chlorobiota bacterium]